MTKILNSPDRKALSTLCDNVANIPVSPTANLKLLTKVASELVSPVLSHKVSSRKSKGNVDSKTRKEKSLGILCDRFLAMFPVNLPPGCQAMEICLDQVAEQLGIVKRRIYDIINILESLNMASKVAKNRYHWHGCNNLQSTLSQLKTIALEYGIDEKLQNIQSKQRSGFRLVSGPTCCCSKDLKSYISSKKYSSNQTGGERSNSKLGQKFFSDERTLGVMCLKFIMLFLVSSQSSSKINLDLATRMLVCEAADASERDMWGMELECHRLDTEELCITGNKSCKCMLRLKTKVRRLYDIANVLTSLGLITKVENQTSSMRKPVFAYTGPSVKVTPGGSTNTKYFSMKSIAMSSWYDENEGVENKIGSNLKRKNCNFKDAVKIGPIEKFPRISSENSLDVSVGRCPTSYVSARHVHQEASHPQYQCSLDDILLVAGQELEKIRSTEELEAAKKALVVRKKLSFSRCHSDSCIQSAGSEVASDREVKKLNCVPQICSAALAEEQDSTEPKKSVCITLSESKSKRFTITRKLVEVPGNALPWKITKESSLKIKNITPMQAQTLGTLLGIPAKPVDPVKSKIETLSTIHADVFNNNKSLTQSVPKLVMNSYNPSDCGAVSSSSAPGDLYRAIKVGDIVHLVPFVSSATSKVSFGQQMK